MLRKEDVRKKKTDAAPTPARHARWVAGTRVRTGSRRLLVGREGVVIPGMREKWEGKGRI